MKSRDFSRHFPLENSPRVTTNKHTSSSSSLSSTVVYIQVLVCPVLVPGRHHHLLFTVPISDFFSTENDDFHFQSGRSDKRKAQLPTAMSFYNTEHYSAKGRNQISKYTAGTSQQCTSKGIYRCKSCHLTSTQAAGLKID